jgi:hypothetical protein
MNALAVALIAFACLFGGALAGMWIRSALPKHHLSDDSRNLLGMGMGVIGTMSGLVLGLLVASATGAYNAQGSELIDASSKIIMLDRMLAHYGPEGQPARSALRTTVASTLARLWPQEGGSQIDPSAVRGERILDDIEGLTPSDDAQRSLKGEALTLAMNLGQIRWLIYAQSGSSLSVPLLVLLIFWFTITFVGFGLFSPPNATVVVALVLCALAVSGAIFVTLELYRPFEGIVQLSSTPLREALAHISR